jgi:hypothetical protein
MIYITQGIQDIAGNQLYQSYSGSFTTGETLTDNTGPAVVDISPMTGASGVPLNTNVMIKLSEPVAGTTVNNQTLIVSAGGVQLAGDITIEQGATVIRYKPANLELFAANTVYDITLTTGVTDLSGNPLQGQYTSFFTTGGSSDSTAPTVVSRSPASNAQNVPLDTQIVITLSEPINPLSVEWGSFY